MRTLPLPVTASTTPSAASDPQVFIGVILLLRVPLSTVMTAGLMWFWVDVAARGAKPAWMVKPAFCVFCGWCSFVSFLRDHDEVLRVKPRCWWDL